MFQQTYHSTADERWNNVTEKYSGRVKAVACECELWVLSINRRHGGSSSTVLCVLTRAVQRVRLVQSTWMDRGHRAGAAWFPGRRRPTDCPRRRRRLHRLTRPARTPGGEGTSYRCAWKNTSSVFRRKRRHRTVNNLRRQYCIVIGQ